MALEGKRALITGSSRGIGRGIALKLAECGVAVAVHYHKDERAAADTLARVRERGVDGCVVQADVSRFRPLLLVLAAGKTASSLAALGF